MSNNNLFLISGRLAFDDDDTVYIVEAESLDEAIGIFEDNLRFDHEDGDREFFLGIAGTLDECIEVRLKKVENS